MTTHNIDTWRLKTAGTLRRLRDSYERTATPPPATGYKPWYGHIDTRIRSGPYPSGAAELSATGATHTGSGFDAFDLYLKDSLTAKSATVPTGPVGQFMHGYSGQSHPTLFSNSTVSAAPSKGIGAMLNTKLDWNALANGTYDSLITGFFNSWPVGTWGEVTINHEPENEIKPANSGNPDWVAWANVNAPIWKAGVNRYIDLAAPIIRSRGLDVKVGGVLMDFSWDSDRWTWWNWWDDITPANLNEVMFGIDIYAKTLAGPVAKDLTPKMNTILGEVRSVGIGSFSLWETGLDRRSSLSSLTSPIIGTEASTTAGWDAFYKSIQKIPEIRSVCYFHLAPTPTTSAGAASAQDYLTGASITKYADIAMQGRRGA